MNGVIGGLDQGVRLFQLRVLNLNALFETIPKTQHQSLEHQTLIFYSISEHITFHQTSEQASNVMSPKTRAYNLPSVRRMYTKCKGNGDVENRNDTRHYKTNIRE
jgi:hypothetical protein